MLNSIRVSALFWTTIIFAFTTMPPVNPLRAHIHSATGSQLALLVAVEQHVTATLFDSAGRAVATLFDGVASLSEVETTRLERSELASGVYFVRAMGRGGQTAARSFIVH